jgi:hypothetical protein
MLRSFDPEAALVTFSASVWQLAANACSPKLRPTDAGF